MRARWRAATACAAATVAVSAVAVANPASDSVTTLDIETSSKSGTKKRPKPMVVAATVKGSTKSGTGVPSVPTSINTELPSGWRINAKQWPPKRTCDGLKATKLKSDRKVCPKGSLVGTGTTSATAGGTHVKLKVRAYALSTAQLGFWIETGAPIPIARMLNAPIVKKGRGFNVEIPATVSEPLAGVTTAITELKVTFDAKAKVKVDGKTRTIGGVQSTGCKGGKWVFKTTIKFRDGSAGDTDTVKCRS